MDLQAHIKDLLTSAKTPAILCSWGRDSSLLLYYARRACPDIAIYYFGDNLPALAAEMVVDARLAVCSFAPQRSYQIAEVLVDEYSFNGTPVPMLSALRNSDACHHRYSRLRTCALNFYFPQDVVLWGYRREDEHPLLPGVKFEREIQLGHTRFVAPLYDLSTDQVLNALDALGLDYADDSPVDLCDDCSKVLIANASTLAGFQERQINHKETRNANRKYKQTCQHAPGNW